MDNTDLAGVGVGSSGGISRRMKIVRSACALAGGLALKWAITQAGHESAQDAAAAHEFSGPRHSSPGWYGEQAVRP